MHTSLADLPPPARGSVVTRPLTPSWGRVPQAVLLIAPVLAFAFLAWNARTVVDDAYINFRIVENVRAGHGPVYNVGERVEAGTSPAWLFVLWLLSVLLGPAGVTLPWIAVVAGIACGVGGLAFAELAAVHMWSEIRARDQRWLAPLVPAGAAIVLAVAPFWQFVASGLETGLAMLWLGASAYAVATAETEGRHWWRAALVGLGPLVRPDFALFSGPLLLALLVATGPDVRRVLAVLAWALALPVGVEVFRMGYYAALVPNTALAKEAFEALWGRGFTYLRDFSDPYWLIVPMLPVFVMTVRLTIRATPLIPRATVIALVIGGFANALYVVRVGGDFMHARMLLPATFALIAAPSMWPVKPRRRGAAFALVAQVTMLLIIGVWAVVCGTSLRVSYRGQTSKMGIADESGTYQRYARRAHPVIPDDFRGFGAVETGERLRTLASEGRRLVVFDDERWPLAEGAVPNVVTDGGMIGIAGYTAGPSVHMADTLGLTDPIASRLRLDMRVRAGHEKQSPRDWMAARYVAVDALPAVARRYASVEDARVAVGCGRLRELIEAITAPMTAGRFVRNLVAAPALTSLRIAANPATARQELCR